MTQWQKLCYALGIKRMPKYIEEQFSRRFLFLDFLSGGQLVRELYNVHNCIAAACNNHDRVWLPDYPGVAELLRKGKTEAECHDRLNNNLNCAKGILIKKIYKI